MVTIRRWLAGCICCLLAGLSAGTVHAQVPPLFQDLPPVNITFDDAINQFGPDAQSITNSHNLARQQVRLALAYLTTHRDLILAGLDPFYNQRFGAFYDRNNPFIGQYDLFIQGVVLAPFSIFGTVSVTAGDSMIMGTDTSFLAGVQPGYQYAISGFDSGIAQVVTIVEVVDDTTLVADGLFVEDGSMLTMRQVIGTDTRINTSHYDQVVATFQQISNLLDQSTNYNGAFDQALYEAVFAPDNATFLGFDRAFRQDGLSNSPSPTHFDQLINDPNNPLLWTADNVEFLDDAGNPLPIDKIYFNDHMTIFGENDNPNNQTVGQSFLDEQQDFVGDFFDGSISDVTGPTEFNQWQMITQSFAESSTDISQTGVAGINVQPIYDRLTGGMGSADFLQNKDAGNYANFADLFKDVDLGGIGIPSYTPGKQATAGSDENFSPFIPFL